MTSPPGPPPAEPPEPQGAGRPEPQGAGPPDTGPAESGPAESGPRSLRASIGRVAAASGAALILGQFITLAQTVALARLLTPTEVGLFAAGTVLTMFLANFVEGGLRSGLVHREGDLTDASETVFWVTIGSGLLMSLGALIAAPVIGLIFHSSTAGYIAASSAGVLLMFSLTSVPEALLQREFSVKRRLLVGPAIALSFAAVSVTMAALGFGVWSMVAGFYASNLTWVVGVWCLCPWRPGRGKASYREWRRLARYGFPLVLGMIGARVQQLAESIVVGRGLSTAALGYYRYGQRISQIPVSAIIEIGSVSLFPAFSRISGDLERFRRAFLRALGLAVAGAAAVSALMIALGVPAVVAVFGEKWHGAGVVVATMAGLGLGKALICVSEEAIKGAGRTALLNWYTLLEVTLGLSLLLLFIWQFGLVGVGLSVSITALAVGALCLGMARSVLSLPMRPILGVLTPPILSAAAGLAVVWPLEHLVLQSASHGLVTAIGLLTLDTVIFTAVYVALLAVFGRPALQSARDLVSQLRGRSEPLSEPVEEPSVELEERGARDVPR